MQLLNYIPVYALVDKGIPFSKLPLICTLLGIWIVLITGFVRLFELGDYKIIEDTFLLLQDLNTLDVSSSSDLSVFNVGLLIMFSMSGKVSQRLSVNCIVYELPEFTNKHT